jgi:POT family proton-dependent oligopeptide transporter
MPGEPAQGIYEVYEIATYIGSLACAIPFILLLVTNTAYTDMFMYIIGPATLVYLGWEMRNLQRGGEQAAGAALVFILFSILFWAFFEQSGGSLSLFALNNLKPACSALPHGPQRGEQQRPTRSS